jgi:hypothetical protein
MLKLVEFFFEPRDKFSVLFVVDVRDRLNRVAVFKMVRVNQGISVNGCGAVIFLLRLMPTAKVGIEPEVAETSYEG